MNELQFLGSDPGAVKHGNFINYYSFHSPAQRITNLHDNMFPATTTKEPILCLDIGCNTGELTKELQAYIKKIYTESDIYFLAVDIDQTLIQRAKETNPCPYTTYETLNVMDEADRQVVKKYLEDHGKQTFDITFCFSVTMWIHLNNGDEGLEQFLQYIKSISTTIIIEPQPWNCYRNAQKRIKKSGSTFPLYETLKIRSNVDLEIENVMIQNGHKKVYESGSSSWNRKIQSYTK
ncbi:probable RNA methyltransferase CG11342 [Ostrinia nubilalis]|uniref:probable RNA methyltransferase CG11342 n=1 Tax=Ostrinia nubilalis TaxID=29057 RepID=UPI00308262EB